MDIAKFALRLFGLVPGGLLLFPLGFLFWKAYRISPELLRHVEKYLLWEGLLNTLLLLVSVLLISSIFGFAMAWLIGRYEFVGRSFFRRALLLPLALPAYVVSFVWIANFGQAYPFVQVVLVLSLCLFPYTYLILLENMERLNKTHFEVADSLGLSRIELLRRVYLPLLMPALLASSLLVGMETLADFGSVSVYNIHVLTTLVYRSWFALQSLETASFFAVLHVVFLLGFVLCILRTTRKSIVDKAAGHNRYSPKRLKPIESWLAGAFVFCVWSLAFVFPVVQLLVWSVRDGSPFLDSRLWERIGSSLLIAFSTSLVTLVLVVILWVARRYFESSWLRWASQLSGLGYGIPGTVIAVGWMVSLTMLLGTFHHLPLVAFSALVLGLATRFFSLAQRPLEAASERVGRNLEEAARSSGASTIRVFKEIYRPLLSGALGAGFMFVFIDTLKEMPMTLLMRPYGWDTLAVRVYQFTSDGLWQEAAAPALVIVLVSLAPLLLWRRQL